MDEATEPSARGWRIDLSDPPRLLAGEGEAALVHASEESALLRSQLSGSGEWEKVLSAARSAAFLGADEHELAVATGFTLEAVRSMLREA
ncbi:hypothetical protein GSU69_08750 [Rathayibacter festucae]|uniref:Uncharacterized protein n=1 Tax=Rathayibacter festucae TaxID=110937 RepID=A0ABX6GZ01_9MICO|nr:hypothetical protein [Rathayibacter festucae]QHC62760.1 hypothetical protein GSU69_08750 [Rathayibacter festucae]